MSVALLIWCLGQAAEGGVCGFWSSMTQFQKFQNTSISVVLSMTTPHPHYTYTFAVTAVTIRPGPYSEPQTITTPEDCKFLFLTSENCSLLVLATLYSSFEYHHNKTYALSITNFSDTIECSHIANAWLVVLIWFVTWLVVFSFFFGVYMLPACIFT